MCPFGVRGLNGCSTIPTTANLSLLFRKQQYVAATSKKRAAHTVCFREVYLLYNLISTLIFFHGSILYYP